MQLDAATGEVVQVHSSLTAAATALGTSMYFINKVTGGREGEGGRGRER